MTGSRDFGHIYKSKFRYHMKERSVPKDSGLQEVNDVLLEIHIKKTAKTDNSDHGANLRTPAKHRSICLKSMM